MDNEISEVVKQFLLRNNITLELTPAHVHQQNAAERAIRTWKNHFLAGLASLNPCFPLQYWSHLLPQSEIKLNLLRQSRLNPRLLAYAQIQGHFNFNRTPMAPPGCEMIAFQPPAQRPSWGFDGYKAWYTRPALNHYWCVQAINATTGRETTVETLQFLPHNFTSPVLTPPQLATIAAQQLIDALNANTNSPMRLFRPNELETATLRQLATIFQSMAEPSTRPPENRPMDLIVPPVLPLATAQPPNPSPPTQPLPRVMNPTIATPTAPPTPPRNSGNIPHVITQPEEGEAALAQHCFPPPKIHHTAHIPNAQVTNVTLPLPSTLLNEYLPHPFAGAVYDEETGKLLEYHQLIKHKCLGPTWTRAAANEFGRLAKGIRDIPGTNTITFIPLSKVPKNKTVTYARFVADIGPQKADPNRVRMTIGDNLIQYDGDVSSPTIISIHRYLPPNT